MHGHRATVKPRWRHCFEVISFSTLRGLSAAVATAKSLTNSSYGACLPKGNSLRCSVQVWDFSAISSSPSAWKEMQIVTFLEFGKKSRPETNIAVLSEISFLVTERSVNCHINPAYSTIFKGKFTTSFSSYGMLAATRAYRWYRFSIRQKKDNSFVWLFVYIV